jgi:hypothetical protein
VVTDPATAPNTEKTDAEAYVRAWHRRAAALDLERLRDLRQLSEVEAAQRFARLLWQPAAYPLRKESGLVEQQRIFSRLRNRGQ